MKVLFDISVIELAGKNLLARTGVYRAIENLLRSLAINKEISLTAISCYGERKSDQILEYYLASSSELDCINLYQPRFEPRKIINTFRSNLTIVDKGGRGFFFQQSIFF